METSKEFKFSTEGAVIMFLDAYQAIQQIDLDEYAKTQTTFTEVNPCNIYFILRRARVTINPDSFRLYDDHFSMEFEIHKQNERQKVPLSVGLDRKINLELRSTYPFNEFEIYEGTEPGLRAKAAVYLDEAQRQSPMNIPELDFEVLYIGQSLGEDGKRTAIDRIGQHSTLQKIYSEAIARHPDSEIWLLLTSFSQKNIAVANGTVKTKSNESEDLNRFQRFTSNSAMTFSEAQRINFTEAALIRYFEPHYNDKYKKNFPDPKHKTYSECYDLDLNAMVIELHTGEMKRCLYTVKRPRRLYHQETFHFATDQDRWRLFNWD